jgi:cysteinyl-tRNA synthetase
MDVMDIYLHNTLTGKKEKFEPIEKGKVGIYSCGPTVYDFAHIGNFRTFIFGDILRRMFEYNSYVVNQVMNITDVDDKTIKKSQQEKISLSAVTKKYEDLFFKDLQTLNILPATKTPRATESIADMIELIEKLLQKEVAYQTSDGIYFDISKSENYGELAHLDKQIINKERVTGDEYDKENARDFALWKLYSEEDGEVYFDAPFGKGRPGWHIECSAMSMKNIGPNIDIHIGGVDLIFPHHTNEIAQSEAATGERFVNYWVHGEFITVDGKKMSKSLGNIFTIKDILEKKIDPLAFRYLVLSAHYDTLLNFTWEALSGSQKSLEKLVFEFDNLPDGEADTETLKKFRGFINDDLDMPKALALLHESFGGKKSKKTIEEMDKVFGLSLVSLSKKIKSDIPEEVLEMKKERDSARAQKNFQKSDELREEIEREGYIIEDADGKSTLRKNLSALN